MRSLSSRLLLLALPILIGIISFPAVAVAEAQFAWSWDQVTFVPSAEGEVVCQVAGAPMHYGEPGEPDLPALLVQVRAPEGSTPASFRIAGEVTSDREVEGSYAPAWEDRPAEMGGPVPVPPHSDVYQALSYPTERVRFLGLSSKRGTVWASFAVYPLTLQRGHKLVLLEQGTLSVQWKGDPAAVAPLKTLRPETVMDLDRDEIGKSGLPIPAESGLVLDVSDRPSLSGSAVRYVVVTSEALKAAIQDFATWKNEMGTTAAVRTVEWIYQNYNGVDKQDKIRNFLIEAYRYWGTEWVLIAGSPEQVPIRLARYLGWNYPAGADIITDYYYSCLDGTWNADGDAVFGEAYRPPGGGGDQGNPVGDNADFAPELIVGRIPATSASELDNWWQKYRKYVKTPDTASGYLDKTLMLGEVLFNTGWSRAIKENCNMRPTYCNLNQCSGICVEMDGAEDCVNSLKIIDSCGVSLEHIELYENFEYWKNLAPVANRRPNGQLEVKSAVVDYLRAGAGWIQHIGHGSYDRISVGSDDGIGSSARLVNADAGALNNTDKPGIIYSINCTSAAINSDCIAAAFLFAPNGGEVCYIGSSNLDFPTTARYYQSSFFHKAFIEGMEDGRAFTEVIDEMARGLGNTEGYRRFLTFSLIYLGDPQMTAWIGSPATMTVSASNMTLGADSVCQVTVMRSGSPVANARVAAYKVGDAYGMTLTGADGVARVPFRPTQTGDFKVTVTHPRNRADQIRDGMVPVQVTKAVSGATSGSMVVVTGVTIDDGTGGGTKGNRNGRLEVGETANLNLAIKNTGVIAATGVQFSLYGGTTSAYLDIQDGSASYAASLAPGATATVTAAFRIRVKAEAGGLPYQNQDRLSYDTKVVVNEGLRSGTQNIPLFAYRPILRLLRTDLEGGGTNGRPDNDEVIRLKPVFRNIGTGTYSNARVYVTAAAGSATMEIDRLSLQEPIEQGTTFSSASADSAIQFRVDDAAALRLTLTVRSILDPNVTFFSKTIEFGIPAKPVFPVDAEGTPIPLGASKDAINVVWRKTIDRDLQGYILKRSTSPAGVYQQVNADLLSSMTFYRDEGLPGLTRFYYRVAAVDSSGNVGFDSDSISATTSPGYLGGWPILLSDVSPGCPTIENIDKTGPYEILANSDFMYALRADGSEVTDGDHVSSTNGIFSDAGSAFWGKPAIADLDGDGTIEVAAACRHTDSNTGPSRMVVWNSAGTVLWAREVSSNSNLISCAVIADIDSDPQSEVLCQHDGAIYAWNHDGSPVIAANANGRLLQVATGAQYTYGSPAVADLDGDGKDEIVYAYHDAGIFPKMSVIDVSGGAASILVTVDLEPTGGQCNASPSIVYDNGQWMVYVTSRKHIIGYRWNAGTLQRVWQRWNGGLAYTDSKPYDPVVAIGDVDGDGSLDVVCPGSHGKIYVLNAQNGDSLFDPIQIPRDNAWLGSPVLVNLDQDAATAEILIGDEQGTVYGLGGVGVSLPGFPYRVGGAVMNGIAVWDVDRDGKPNIAIQANQVTALTVLDITNTSGFPNVLATAMSQNPWPSYRHDARNTGRIDAHVITPVATMTAAGSSEAGAAIIRWDAPVIPETFRIERSADDGDWSERAQGPAAQFSGSDPENGPAFEYRDLTDPGTFTYRVIGLDRDGSVILRSGEVAISVRPVRLRLIGAVPNPFNPRTAIKYESPAGMVHLEIVDPAGRRVRVLVNGSVTGGTHEVIWDGRDADGRDVGSGVYFACLRGTGGARSQKVVLLR
jgi:hypothetical protein